MKEYCSKYLKVFPAIMLLISAGAIFAQDIIYTPYDERIEVYTSDATNATKEIIGDYSFTDLESPNNRDGGAIDIRSVGSGNSSLTLTGNFRFIQNKAVGTNSFWTDNKLKNGGAVSVISRGTVTVDITAIDDHGNIFFSENRTSDHGGGIAAISSYGNDTVDVALTVGNNGNILFENNTAGFIGGGGIYLYGNTSYLSLNAGYMGNISFVENNASVNGGGIYVDGERGVIVNLNTGHGGTIYFTGNNADIGGGGIAAKSGNNGDITVNLTVGDEGKIVFSENLSNSGSAIATAMQSDNVIVNLTVGSAGEIIFSKNSSQQVGGALTIQGKITSVNLNAGSGGSISFFENKVGAATGMGGAISLYNSANAAGDAIVNITAVDNGNICFYDNSAGYGGSIFVYTVGSNADSTVVLNVGDRGFISFFNNSAIAELGDGGGINILSKNVTTFDVTTGDEGCIIFSENYAHGNGGSVNVRSTGTGGGANIYLNTGDEGRIEFTNNMSHASGGALYISGSNNVLSLSGGKGSSIVFSGNKQNVDVSEEGIPQNNTGVANAIAFTGKTTFNFNIDENGVIAFYDPIVTTASNVNRASVNLNDPASRADGDSTGTILLNGIDYIGKADANRYYNMVNDTVVYGGAFGVANNIIYGRNINELGAANPSTLTINDSVTLFSMQTLDGTIAVNNIINANVTNNGLLRFINQTPNSYHMLTINSLRGSSNIHMSFDSELGDTDVLNINTDAEGSHVVSALGTGSGTLERIENVIRVGDPTPEDIFTGGGVAGLYNYDLEQNLLGNWDLVRGAKNNNSDITIDSLAALSIGWFTQLSNLNKRLGQLHTVDYDIHSQDVWIRTFGGQVDSKLNVTNNIQFKEYNYGVDFGGDLLKLDKENRKGIVGIYGGYMRGDRKFTDATGSTGNTISYYGGMYGTWINDKGLYFDLVTKVQDYRTSFTTDTESANFKNYGFGASIETGKPYNFKNGYFVEPRVQLAYLHLNSSKFALGSNESLVRINDANIYRFLGGAKFGQLTSVGSDNKPFIWYVSTDIEGQRSFGGRVDVVDESYSAKTDGIRSVFGLGIMYDDSDSSQLYINLESSFGEKYNRPWNFIGGYRKMF